MNVSYLKGELLHQKRRTLASIVGLSIGVALLVITNALSMAYYQAARIPLKEIGADITVQRSGNVPKDLSGSVFPCSAVTIRDGDVRKIAALPGVEGVGRAVLLWIFDPHQAWIVLGIEQTNTVGPAVLRNAVRQGRFLEQGKAEAIVEAAYAHKFGIKVGDTLSLAKRTYPVVGILDASKAAKIAIANVYLPLSEAQGIAASSNQVQDVSPFDPHDVNLLFIRAESSKIPALAASLRTMLGKQATIGTPDSFLKLLGSLFALSDKFTVAASLIAIIIAALVAFKTMAGNIAERAREIGVLKAVGWTGGNVMSQIMAESVVQSLMGGVLGLAVAYVGAFFLSFMTVNIPIPWEMSPVPHFLPGGGDQIYKTLNLPVYIPWTLAAFAVLLSLIIGVLTGSLLTRAISRIKPSEVLRHE
ncbi:MAG TPA: ABC transporter permease [Deltaproteobacteria bacterium]|nr:ABC transporter permease [Deltaproteobacteria bacterium]HQH99873.1 ABC transporter permease [Deltaproteobacteria bacterium]